MMKSRRIEWAGHVARTGRSGMHTGFCWERQKKRTTRKWDDTIKLELREIRWGVMGEINVTQNMDQ
jgi:hypothetical protein